MLTAEVPAHGPLTAQVALVGEAPGAEEIRARRPFVGPSGQWQDRMMLHAGINPASVYKTNVIKRRPTDIAEVIKFGAKSIEITDEFVAWREALYLELAKTEANVIVAVGAIALYALTGHQGIMKWRGSILRWQDRKVIPIIHPAALLRRESIAGGDSPGALVNVAQQDWRRVYAEASSRDYTGYSDKWLLEPTYPQIVAFMQRCAKAGICAIDIEVQNGELSCFGVALASDEAMCIPFLKNGKSVYEAREELAIMRGLAGFLESKAVVKIGQNLTFDAGFLFRKYGIRCENLEDTMIAWAVAFPDLPKRLAMITSLMTRREYYKDDGKTWETLLTPESFWVYNCKDAAVCMEVWPKLVQVLGRQNNREAYERQRSVIQSWIYATERGMRVHKDWLPDARACTDTHLAALIEEWNIRTNGVSPGSPVQLKTLFYSTLGHVPFMNRKTGKATTDKSALQRLAAVGCVEAKMLMRIRREAKITSTYFHGQLDADHRIRSSVNPAGAATGRPSSSKTIFKTGMNQFNLPPRFKQLVFADPGYTLYVLDLSQAENRIVAYVANEGAMMAAFERGDDVHRLTASLIFRVLLSEVTPAMRKVAKACNHGLNYGLGYKRFALMLQIREQEAKLLVERYHQIYPNIRQVFHAFVERSLVTNRTITNCYGRARVFMGEVDSKMRLAANAQIPQSSVTDHMNLYGIRQLYGNQALFGPAEFLCSVYDSLVFQVPLAVDWKHHAEMLTCLVRSLQTPLHWGTREFVIPVDVRIGTTLAAKTGVPVREGGGVLETDLASAWASAHKEGWDE